MTTQTTLSATELNEEFGEFAEMLSERYDNLFSKEQALFSKGALRAGTTKVSFRGGKRRKSYSN